MAVELATAYIALVPSAKGIEAKLKSEMVPPAEKVGRDAGEKAGAGFRERFQRQLGGIDLADVGRKGLAATAVLATGMFAAASAASSLEAAIAANVQVLGDASVGVQRWAKTSVEAVGLSERAAVEATTSFGQLAKVAGLTGDDVSGFSIEMVQLAADMAAFKDVGVDVALADLQSGFAGSTEVLRKYAIFLDDAGLKAAYFRATGEEVTGTLTAQQRVIATHAEIMRQSADMQGQWSRESDGLAARQAKLKAEFENTAATLGSALLPAFTALVGGVSDVVGIFGRLNEETGGAVAKVVGFGTVALGAVSATAYLSAKVSDLATKFRAMSTGMQGATAGLGIFTAAAVVGYSAGAYFAQQRTERLTQSIADLTRATDAQALDAFGQALVSALAGDVKGGPAAALDQIVQSSLEGSKRILELARSTGRYSEVTDDLAAAIAREEQARAQAALTTETYTDAGTAAEDATVAQAEAAAAAEEATLEQAAAQQKARDAFRDATDAARNQLDAIRDLYGEQLSQIDATRAYERATLDTRQAVADYAETLADSSLTSDELASATLRTADQIYSTARAFAESKGAALDSKTGIALMIDELYRQAVALDPSSPLRQQLLGYIGDLQSIPSEVDVNIRLRVTGQTVTRDGDIIGVRAISGNAPIYSAAGRYVDRPVLSWLGEGGKPEVVLPLTQPDRIRELVADPRVAGPLADAMGPAPSSSSAFGDIVAYNFGTIAGAVPGQGHGGDFHLHNHGRDVSVDELSRAVTLAGMR